jgi:hypothetical protein
MIAKTNKWWYKDSRPFSPWASMPIKNGSSDQSRSGRRFHTFTVSLSGKISIALSWCNVFIKSIVFFCHPIYCITCDWLYFFEYITSSACYVGSPVFVYLNLNLEPLFAGIGANASRSMMSLQIALFLSRFNSIFLDNKAWSVIQVAHKSHLIQKFSCICSISDS